MLFAAIPNHSGREIRDRIEDPSPFAMNTLAWQLKGSQAQLEIAGLRGTLDTTDPIAGLTLVRGAGAGPAESTPADLQLFALEWPAMQAVRQRPASPECRLCCDGLVAIYRESPAWPIQLDVVWRAVPPPDDKRVVAVLDVVLSIHTSLLDSHPQLTVATTVPKCPAFRLTDWASVSWQSLDVAAGREQVLEPPTGCGCVMLRVPGEMWSYAEMVHPADFRRDRCVDCRPDRLQLRHSLFPQTLEKGVLVRARMRGTWVARDGDLETAAACYFAFAAGEPPLGTYGSA